MANASRPIAYLAFILHTLDPTHNRRDREALFGNRVTWHAIKGWEKQRRRAPYWAIATLRPAVMAKAASLEALAKCLREAVQALEAQAAIPLARRSRNARLPALRRLLDADDAQRQLAALLNPEKQEGPD